jgi:hypothetical protein
LSAFPPSAERSQRPHNIGSVRNFIGAIRDVRAAFFAIISDDDVLLPEALQRNVSSLLAHPEATAWNGVTLSASERRLVAYRPAPQWPMGLTDGQVALDLISRNIRPETTGMVFRSAVVDDQFCVDDDAPSIELVRNACPKNTDETHPRLVRQREVARPFGEAVFPLRLMLPPPFPEEFLDVADVAAAGDVLDRLVVHRQHRRADEVRAAGVG